MGRTLPVPVSCQVCGDKSYGRHYGVYCCDGCSCFFKRSIRKKIKYTCISGDNACAVDKARRNWCPACRLHKCYTVNMNEKAVQDERGPRKTKLKDKDQPDRLDAATPKTTKHQKKIKKCTDDTQIEQALMSILIQSFRFALRGPVLKFTNTERKRSILENNWLALFLLHLSASSEDNCKNVKNVIQKCQLVEMFNMLEAFNVDPQELHLLTSLILCSTASSLSEVTPSTEPIVRYQLGGLQEIYRLMLFHHGAAFYAATDPLRPAKLFYAVQSLKSVPDQQLSQLFLNGNKKCLEKRHVEAIIGSLVEES